MAHCNRQYGVALIVALVILVPLTFIAVIAMQSSGISLKIAGSSAAIQRVEHATEGGIERAINSTGISSTIANLMDNTPIAIGDNVNPTNILLKVETVCRRKFLASSQNVIPSCRYAEINTSGNYGKMNNQLIFIAGVEQPLLSIN